MDPSQLPATEVKDLSTDDQKKICEILYAVIGGVCIPSYSKTWNMSPEALEVLKHIL